MQTMQSENYVPGVSGWKLHKENGEIELNGMARVAGLTDEVSTPKPFIEIDGVTYISQALIQGSAAKAVADKIASMWSVKLQANGQGQYVAAGIGLGAQEKESTDFDKVVSKGADAVLEFLARAIAGTRLAAELKAAAPASIAEQVRDAIRTEIRPGGLLHRN